MSVDTDDSAFTLRATAISGVTFDFGFSQTEDGGLGDALDRPAQGQCRARRRKAERPTGGRGGTDNGN